jgi:hypothetical protein
MGTFIRDVGLASNDEWDFHWKGCNVATYFHSREWAEVWERYTRGRMRPEPRIITFSDGTSALFPVSSYKSYRGLIKQYISSPGGTFGGWISIDDLSVAHGELLAEHLRDRFTNLSWRPNPYDPIASGTGPPRESSCVSSSALRCT